MYNTTNKKIKRRKSKRKNQRKSQRKRGGKTIIGGKKMIKGGKLIPFSDFSQIPDLLSYGMRESIDTLKIPAKGGTNPLPFIQPEKKVQINNLY